MGMQDLKDDVLSPFDVLEQRKQLERVQEAHNIASVAFHELSNLPSERAVYQKRLNVFFKADPMKFREECRADEKAKRVETMEERNKFEAMKAKVKDERSVRAAHLEQILAGSRAAGTPMDALWDGFGTGERVEVFGLSKAAAYNGRVGVVQRYDGERFAVELEASAGDKKKTLRVKPENLRPLRAPATGGGWHSETAAAGTAFSGVVKER